MMTEKLSLCRPFFFQAEDGIRDVAVTGVQTCALPISQGRVAAGDVAPELATREQDLRRRMAELTQQLESSPDSARGLRDPADAAAGATGAALARAQEAYNTLLVEMREANPAYAALLHGEVAPTRDVMNALTRDEALLEYLVGDSTTV